MLEPKEKAKEIVKNCFMSIGSSYSGYMDNAKDLADYICCEMIDSECDGKWLMIAHNQEIQFLDYWKNVQKEVWLIDNEIANIENWG